MKKNNKKGFTIIEMVIVIAIIGILAAVLIPTYGNVVANANESAAMQTARSVMTNWLASSTSSAGVPTSGPDGNGGTLYAAYFNYTSGNQTYQYRYTSGGVERTDNDASKFVDFAKLPQVTKVYVTNPDIDSNFDPVSYALNLYEVEKTATQAGNGHAVGDTYKVYYIEYPSGSTSETSQMKYAYDFGGANVFAAASTAQEVYQAGTGEGATTYTKLTIADLVAAGKFVAPSAG